MDKMQTTSKNNMGMGINRCIPGNRHQYDRGENRLDNSALRYNGIIKGKGSSKHAYGKRAHTL